MSYGRHGRVAEIQAALNNGFGIDEKDGYGNTLLFVAAQNGLKQVTRLCLRHSADINQKNERGNTPLHYCFKYGHDDLGSYLIRKGRHVETSPNI